MIIQDRYTSPESKLIEQNEKTKGTVTPVPTNSFLGWRDRLLSPIALIGTNGLALFFAWNFHDKFHWGLFACFLVYGIFNFIITTAFLRFIVTVARFTPGRYDAKRNPWTYYAYNLYSFIATTNLHYCFENNVLIPSAFYQFFCKLQGSKCGKGFLLIAGHIRDPFLLTLESDVIIGTGTLILGHYYTATRQLRLGHVVIKRGALIGVNTVIFPNCVVGENATVAPGAILSPGTIVPANEVWAGNPARKDEMLSAKFHSASSVRQDTDDFQTRH